MKIVILGNGPGALRALQVIAESRHELRDLAISLVSAETGPAYAPMFLVSRSVGELDDDSLLIPEPALPVRRFPGKKAVRLDERNQTVRLDDGQVLGYDRLLIATGASAVMLPSSGGNNGRILSLNRLADAKRLSASLKLARDIVVIGAGMIGVEAALAFRRLGKRVTVVELAGSILSQVLDPDLSLHVQSKLLAQGIDLRLQSAVSNVSSDKHSCTVQTGQETIKADLALVAIGVKPNIGFLESSDIKTDRGVLVDEKMQTNIPGVYAAGDVAQSPGPYGEHETGFNYYRAIEQGRVAGLNIIGQKKTCAHSPCLAALKIGIPVVSIGRKYHVKYEVLSNADPRQGIYERFYLRESHIDCYQAVGVSEKAGLVYQMIKTRQDVSRIKDLLVSPVAILYRFLDPELGAKVGALEASTYRQSV